MSILQMGVKIIVFTAMIPVYVIRILVRFLTKERDVTKAQATLTAIAQDYVLPRVDLAKAKGMEAIQSLKANK